MVSSFETMDDVPVRWDFVLYRWVFTVTSGLLVIALCL